MAATARRHLRCRTWTENHRRRRIRCLPDRIGGHDHRAGRDNDRKLQPAFPAGADLPVSNDQPSVALTYLVATSGLFPSNSNLTPNTPYLGEVIAYAGGAPNAMLQGGWAVANGQTLSIAQNAALFSVLGTTYGGNGHHF